MVVAADGALTLAIVPTSRSLDLKRLAAAVGARRAVMAEPADAERATGYLVGGISPIATTRRMRVVLDVPAASLERVFVSAGRRGLQVSLRPEDLVATVGATVALISAARADTQCRLRKVKLNIDKVKALVR
ncbi:MAG: YbaK/EbsC family protein [Chloroflexota bacterium]